MHIYEYKEYILVILIDEINHRIATKFIHRLKELLDKIYSIDLQSQRRKKIPFRYQWNTRMLGRETRPSSDFSFRNHELHTVGFEQWIEEWSYYLRNQFVVKTDHKYVPIETGRRFNSVRNSEAI